MPRPSIQLIINPVSGGRRRPSPVAAVRAELRGFGEVAAAETSAPGDARRLAAGLDPASCRLVIAVGGDGTVREIAEGLAGRPIPLGLIPRGTGNVLARELGLPGGARRAAALLRRGTLRRLDVGLANGRRFLSLAGVGFDSRVAAELAHRRRGHAGIRHYFLPLARALLAGPPEEFRVRADGRDLGPWRLITAANTRAYGVSLDITPRADPADGRLDACLFRGGRLDQLVRYLIGLLSRTHWHQADVLSLRVSALRLEAQRPVPYQVDGEHGGFLPLELGLAPAPLYVVAPPPRGAPPRNEPEWLGRR